MRRRRMFAVITAVAVPATILSGLPAVARSRAPLVRLQAANFRFCPASASTCLPERDDNSVATVLVGTRLTWTYADSACDAIAPCPGHNVVFGAYAGSQRLVKRDGALIFSMVFRRPGTYTYYCSAHKSFGMTGTIVVRKHR